MSVRLRRSVAETIASSFAKTDGGEPGLHVAVGETLAQHAAENLDAEGLDKIEDAIIGAVQQVRGRADRDPLGLVLTPSETAMAVSALLKQSFPEAFREPVVVLDPACGTGRLLSGAINAGLPAVRRIGWDIDPVVLTLGNGLSTLRGRASLRADLELRQTDGLDAPRPDTDGKPLVVVSNPPFVAAYARRSQAAEMDTEVLASVARGWSSGRVNAAIGFVARIVRDLLRPGEVAGLIVPDALLSSPRYAMFRAALIEHVDAVVIGRVPAETFEGRGVRAVVIAVRRAAQVVLTADDCRTRLHRVSFATWGGEAWVDPQVLDIDAVLWSPTNVIPWPSPRTAMAFAFAVAGHRLSHNFDVADGVNPGSAEARAALVHEGRRGLSRPRPLLEGKDITMGHVGTPRLWLETDEERIEPEWKRGGTSLRRSEIFHGPRLYSRQTTDRLTCGFVNDDSMVLNSAHIIRWSGPRARAEQQLRWLCAVLCTRIVTELYQALFAEDRALFPQVKVTNLRAIPLPWPPPPNVTEAADRWMDAPSDARFRHVDELTERWLADVATLLHPALD